MSKFLISKTRDTEYVNKVAVEDDVKGSYGEPVPTIIDTIDAVLVRGISVDRNKNGKPKDYKIWNNINEIVY